MRKLEGGCSVPLGVRCSWSEDDKNLKLSANLMSVDGSRAISAEGNVALITESSSTTHYGYNQEEMAGITLPVDSEIKIKSSAAACFRLGQEVANKIIDSGGLELLRSLR